MCKKTGLKCKKEKISYEQKELECKQKELRTETEIEADFYKLFKYLKNPYSIYTENELALLYIHFDAFASINPELFYILFADMFLKDNGKKLLRQKITEMVSEINTYENMSKDEAERLFYLLTKEPLKIISNYSKMLLYDKKDIEEQIRLNKSKNDNWEEKIKSKLVDSNRAFFEDNMSYFLSLGVPDWHMLICMELVNMHYNGINNLVKYTHYLILTEYDNVKYKGIFDSREACCRYIMENQEFSAYAIDKRIIELSDIYYVYDKDIDDFMDNKYFEDDEEMQTLSDMPDDEILEKYRSLKEILLSHQGSENITSDYVMAVKTINYIREELENRGITYK